MREVNSKNSWIRKNQKMVVLAMRRWVRRVEKGIKGGKGIFEKGSKGIGEMSGRGIRKIKGIGGIKVKEAFRSAKNFNFKISARNFFRASQELRIKDIRNIFAKPFNRRVGAGIVLVIFVVANFLQNSPQTQSAQYSFAQTDWSGGVTANTAVHPDNESGWNQYSSGTNVTTTTAGQATLAETAHENFAETFSADTFKDATNTTANWNTTTGQVEMATETSGVNLYEKLNGVLAGSQILSQVKDGNDYYVGSSSGKFLKYNSVSEVVTDLTSKISSFIPGNFIYAMALDSANNVIYLGSEFGRSARYNTASYVGGGTYPTADTAYSLTSKISPIFTSTIKSFAFDNVNNILYIGEGSGKFGRYNTAEYVAGGTYPTADTVYNLTTKISSFWSTIAVNKLTLDSANSIVYILGASNFAKYDIVSDTATDMKGKIAPLIGSIEGIGFSVYAEGKIYSGKGAYFSGGGGGSFFAYDISSGITTDLSAKIASFWSGNQMRPLIFDSANKVLYFGGAGGKFARYNLPSYTAGGIYPAADTAYDLTAKISSFWSANNVHSLALDSTNNVVYIGGYNGKFAKYTISTDTATDLTAKISSFWGTNDVYSLAFDSVNNVLYLGGNSGMFSRYNLPSYTAGGAYPTADTAYNLSAKNPSPGWGIPSLAFDSVKQVLYLGGWAGKFGRYNTTFNSGSDASYPATDTGYDLTAKISSFWGGTAQNIYSMAFDSANDVLYLGGGNGKFARYNTTSYTAGGTYSTADTAYNLTAKISSFWSTSYVYSLAFDSINNFVFLGGASAQFGKYSAGSDSAENVSSSLHDINFFSPFTTLNDAIIDSANSVLYVGGLSGIFLRYNTASYTGGGTYPTANTVYSLTAKISSFFNADILSTDLDSANSTLYIVGAGGKFARYNTTSYAGGGTYPTADTAYDLAAKVSSFWSTNTINSIVLDSASNVLYLGGVAGKFARYNTTSYVAGGTYASADTAYDLTGKVNGAEWNRVAITAIVAASGNEIYIGGASGKFAKYNTVTGVVTNLMDKIFGSPVFWSTNEIKSLAFDSANNAIYLGGASGKFARYNTTSYTGGGTYPTADTAYGLSSKISSFWSGQTVYSLAFDSTNSVLYLGSHSRFARYNTTFNNGLDSTYPTADMVHDLSALISGVSGYSAFITFDSTNNVVYTAGYGKLVRYNTTSYTGGGTYPAANTAYSLTSKISFWTNGDIYAIAFDSFNKAVYLTGPSHTNTFARYNTTSYTGGGAYPEADTGYNIGGFSGYSYSLLSDPANNTIYVGGYGGKFLRYSIATNSFVDLRSPDILSFWSTVSVNVLAMDSSGKLYIGGTSGNFAEKSAALSVTSAVSTTLDAQAYDIFYATLTKADTVGTGTIGYQLSNDGGVTWETVTPTVNHAFSSAGSDLRFKVSVSGNATVQSLAIEYWSYNLSGELVSSKYDASDPTNVLARMAWTETLPAGTDLKFQIRTAASAVGLDSAVWCGPNDGVNGSCNSGTFFTDPAGTETMDDINNDITNDQWFQYKTVLTSTGLDTPILSDATVTYVVNAPPQLNAIASVGSDGLITVDYDVLDPDTTTGVTPGVVNVGLQYCTANCGTPGSETWADAVTLTGNYGAGITVAEGTWNSYQLVWNPKTDYPNHYNAADFKIRVKADDGELANHAGYGTYSNANFDLDTTDPVLQTTTLLINDSATAYNSQIAAITLKLQNVTGDAATEQLYAQFSKDGVTWYGANGDNTLTVAGNWGTGFTLDTLATHAWPWTMTTRSETIQVRIKDGFNNISTTDSNDVAYNATPEVQTVTASQNATGTVNVSFEIKDADTAIGITPNVLNVTLQYCTANCGTPGSETWIEATTMTGDQGASVATTDTFVTKNLVWTPKTDYPAQYKNIGANFKVRVSVDDGETFHNADSANSGIFVLDTTNPTVSAITLDHSNNQITIPAPTDDSDFEVYAGNSLATLFDLGNKTSPLLNQASTYPNTYAYTMTADPATVYVGAKDAKGNTNYVQATTPARPVNPIYFDISSANQGTYQEFIAWDVVSASQVGSGFGSYQVYRKINSGSFSLLATITDRTLNYHLDRIKDTNDATIDSDPTFDPLNPSIYYYKIITTDTNGNISAFSTIIEDTPNGAGGSDSTPPTISNVAVSNVDTTSATITWDTDELADSAVGYSTDYTYIPERGLSTFEMIGHQITLTGLVPNTTYHINIQSEDIYGNNGSVCYGGLGCSPGSNAPEVFTFTTDPGPAISGVSVSSTNTQATVSWVTSIDSDTYVVYSDTVTNGALINPLEVGTPDLVGGSDNFNHSQILTTFDNLPLISGTTYYFYVKSTDATSQTAIDNNGGSFFSFTTTQDDDPPILTGVNAAIINDTKVAINWTTDEAATSIVNYGTQLGGPYPDTGEVLTYDRSHYVILSPLEVNTVYYYTVTSADINANSVTSTEYTFTTLMNPEQQHPPLATMTATVNDVVYDLTNAESVAVFTPAILTDVSAAIDFQTDQIAMCDIQYRKDGQAYNPTDFIVEETGYNTNHSMHIMSLLLNTQYYFKIECVDNLPVGQAGMVNSVEFGFITLEQQYGTSEIGALGDSTAPVISGVGTKVNSGESVTVTWTTDEVASSYVQYSITSGTYTDMAGDPLVNLDKLNYDTAHAVIINGLIPGIKYFFTATCTDAAGNIATSSEGTFTTSASSSLSSINITSASLGEALVTWTTSEKTSSLVEYGLTNTYGQKKEDTTAVTDHSMTINSLTAANLYHLRVGGKDAQGQRYSSGDYTFTPKSPPQIGLVGIKDITEHGVTISFTTDLPTDYTVTYTSLSDANDSGSKGKPDLSLTHEITLDKLKSGVTYALKIKASDGDGNSVEKEAPSFTTGKDENAPEISKTRTESALAQNDKVQTIISWEANELSTCSLLYREGASGEEKEYKLSNRPTINHVAVITTFKSGTVYYFKVKSTDEAGNESVSSEYALLTPQKKENIIQIIVNNFQDIFSWTSRM